MARAFIKSLLSSPGSVLYSRFKSINGLPLLNTHLSFLLSHCLHPGTELPSALLLLPWPLPSVGQSIPHSPHRLRTFGIQGCLRVFYIKVRVNKALFNSTSCTTITHWFSFLRLPILSLLLIPLQPIPTLVPPSVKSTLTATSCQWHQHIHSVLSCLAPRSPHVLQLLPYSKPQVLLLFLGLRARKHVYLSVSVSLS